MSCRNHGQVLAESAVAMWLVVIGVLFAISMLFTVGSYVLYKEQLAVIANRVAQSVLSQTNDCMWDNGFYRPLNGHSISYSFVANDLKAVGLPPGQVSTSVIPQEDSVKVVLQANNIWLPLSPLIVTIKEVAVAPRPPAFNQPPGLLTLTDMKTKNSVIVPCYGKQLSWGRDLGPAFVWGRSTPTPGAPLGTAQLNGFSYYDSFYMSFNNPSDPSVSYSGSLDRGTPAGEGGTPDKPGGPRFAR